MRLDLLRIVYTHRRQCLPELQISIDMREKGTKISNIFAKNLSNANPAVRFRMARFLGSLANENMVDFLNMFYEKLVDLQANIGLDFARCGVAELLAQFERMEPEKIINVISLLAPMALRASTDPIPTIRHTASIVFGKFVALLTLQSVSFFLI